MSATQCPQCSHVFSANTRVADSAARFIGLPHRPDGGMRWRRLPLLIAEMLLISAMLGWLVSRLGMKAYLILLFPIAMGMILAGFLLLACTWAKLRNPTAVGVIALMSSLTAVTSMHYTDYQRTFRLLRQRTHAVPPEIEMRLTRAPTFGAYLDATANVGLTITGRSEKGIHLGYAGTWAYWLLEALIAGVIAIYGGRQAAREPFCTRCSQWKRERALGTLHSPSRDVLGVIKRGRLADLSSHLPSPSGGNVELTIYECAHCGGEAPVELRLHSRHLTKRGARRRVELTCLTLPGEALPVLERVFAEPVPVRAAA